MSAVADVIVVGLGAHGSATLYQLAKRGVSVLGIDRWSPPHAMGSSHGETRITRQGIGEGDAYVPLALRSHAIWRELEVATGESLLLACGALIVSLNDGRAQLHGKSDFIGRSAGAAERFDIPHERLSAAEIRYRFPQFLPGDDSCGYYEPGGGLVYPDRCIAAQLTAAEALGAKIVRNVEVRSICETPDGVKVIADTGLYEAGELVLTAGAWAPGLIGPALGALKLQPQVLHWFAAEDLSAFDSERCPVFIWTHGVGPEDSFYGFPIAPGATSAVKVATETMASIESPEALDRTPRHDADAAMFDRHLRGRLAGLSAKAVKSVVCVYTTAPDGDFVVGRPTDGSRILLGSGCSGHGFKHSAAFGEMLARAVIEGSDNVIPDAFDLKRAALGPVG